jgi:hypothetical protein
VKISERDGFFNVFWGLWQGGKPSVGGDHPLGQTFGLELFTDFRPFSKKVKTFLDFSRNAPWQGKETKSVNRMASNVVTYG